MNGNTLIAFYSVCGVLIAGLLVRIWFKNRAERRKNLPATPMTPRNVAPDRMPASAPAVPTSAASMPPVVSSVPTPTPSPGPVPVKSMTDMAVSPAASSNIPSPYIASASSTILRSDAISTWENRQLLEHRGILSRTTANAMPRVLAADVPGTDESDRMFGSLNPMLAAMLPESEERREEVRQELYSAGYYNPHAVENLAALRYVLIMLGIVVFGGLLLIVPPRLEPWVVAGLVAGPMLGWALPTLQVRSRAAERVREISRAMPDLLDMLNMCVSQGLTVPDALKRILRDFRGVYPALSQELSIVIDQARINDLHTALEAFGRRINLPEVHSFTTLLIQTERMGTSISEALTTYSDTMRESLKQRADEKGNRATFRLLFPTVLCLMPAVYLFLLGPAVNEMSKFFNEGGRNSLDAGANAIQRLNNQRGVNQGR